MNASLRYLFGRLALVEAGVRAAVARRRQADPDPDDRFRGLYISEADVDRMLGGGWPALPGPAPEAAALRQDVEDRADEAEQRGEPIRLRRLARSFGLSDAEVEVLLVALAPDVDPRLERLYGYLNDDVSQRRATTGLALDLCSSSGLPAERGHLTAAAPLLAGGLLAIADPDRPFPTRPLAVPDRVAGHLLGDDTPDPQVAALLAGEVEDGLAGSDALARALAAGAALGYLREPAGGAGLSVAASALRRAGIAYLALDLTRLEASAPVEAVAAAAVREARFRDATLVAGPVEALADRGPAVVRAFAEAFCPVVLAGARAWDPAWSRAVPCLIHEPPPEPTELGRIWRHALDGLALDVDDPVLATRQFRLAPEQIARAARAAVWQATATGGPIGKNELHAGARAQNAAGLDRLARRIEPRVGWADLVLPRDLEARLHELTARARLRDHVLGEWGMGRASSRGRGVTALFAGESGTGKTMSAEVVAGDLGLDVYLIDLSTVVDKYVGETEKNLERIFVEADRVNGVLVFDEADAIFGKRSDVQDAHDRYANVEIAYLLQRMERFDGLAVLTTNLRANVDEAFTRRLDVIVDFPMPETEDRLRLWAVNLVDDLPTERDLDLDFLAGSFKLSGGNIRNIVLGAAFLAAEEGVPVGMRHLVVSTEREYRKLGRLCVPDEFGPYYEVIAP